MFESICVSAPLILDGEVVKVLNLSKIFLISKVCSATLQNNFILVVIRLSGRISPSIRPDNRIPKKQAG